MKANCIFKTLRLGKIYKFTSLLLFLLIASMPAPCNSKALAQSSQAYDLIAAVNQLRVANGLPPYEINASLMASAQAHSEYQASIGSVTHTGAGGTRARDRAAYAGYGGGATIYVSENIAGGMSFTIPSVVQMWQGDSLHLNTMLGTDYQDIGAGVASSGQQTYYTIDVGYIAGNPINTSNAPASTSVSSAPSSGMTFLPIQASTPQADGSIIHEVKTGQALWNIAAVYEIELADLLQLNNLGSNAFIFPGDTLIIRSAQTTLTPTQKTTATAVLTKIQQELEETPVKGEETNPSTINPKQTGAIESQTQSNPAGKTTSVDPMLFIIGGLVLGGIALIILGNLYKHSDKDNAEDQ